MILGNDGRPIQSNGTNSKAHKQPCKPAGPRAQAETPHGVTRIPPITRREAFSLIKSKERYSGSKYGQVLAGVAERFGL